MNDRQAFGGVYSIFPKKIYKFNYDNKNSRLHSDNLSRLSCSVTCGADVQERVKPRPRSSYLLRVPGLSRTSALLRLLSAPGRLLPDPCSTSASLCCYQGLISSFSFFIFIAAEWSCSSGVERNLHTLPPSRGEERRTLEKAARRRCQTGRHESLVKTHSANIHYQEVFFSSNILFSPLTRRHQQKSKLPFQFLKPVFKDILSHLSLKYLETA